MSDMRQKRTHYGSRGESGEKMPKGATSSDTRGEKKVKVPLADKESGTEGYTREHSPSGAKSRDASGERSKGITGGVGMGKADSLGARSDSHRGRLDGRVGEFNQGKNDSVVYRHNRGKAGFTHKG